jgi:hypothetical protein
MPANALEADPLEARQSGQSQYPAYRNSSAIDTRTAPHKHFPSSFRLLEETDFVFMMLGKDGMASAYKGDLHTLVDIRLLIKSSRQPRQIARWIRGIDAHPRFCQKETSWQSPPTSTSVGCSIANAIARAIASGEIAILSMVSTI